jgi:hypothetical protein
MECEVLVPQPNRKAEIPRSCFDDNSRSAFVDRMKAKYGLVQTQPRKRGTPRHIAVSVAHHGVTQITFHHLGGRS